MRKLMLRLWGDDAGIVALEYLLVATIVGLGLVVGLSALETALNTELTELANAILAVDQSYFSISSVTVNQFTGNVIAFKQGSWAFDAPTNFFKPGTGPDRENLAVFNAANISIIDVEP
jgi:Flp pilus assembly pilin Flp